MHASAKDGAGTLQVGPLVRRWRAAPVPDSPRVHFPCAGGVSMGHRDYIKPALEARGRVYFGKVCMKPGKPLTFAQIERPER